MPWNPGRTLLPLFSRSRRHGMMGMGIGMNVGGTDFTEFGLEEDCVDNTNMEISLKPPLNMISPPLTCIICYSQSSLSLPPKIISLPQKWSSLILTTSSIMILLIPESLPNHQLPLLLFLKRFLHLLNNLAQWHTPFHPNSLYITVTIHCFRLFPSYKTPLRLFYLRFLPTYCKMRALVHQIPVTMNSQATSCQMILTASWSI